MPKISKKNSKNSSKDMPKKKIIAQDINKSEKIPIRDWIYGGLLLVVVAIVPLVVRFGAVPVTPDFFALYGGELFRADFFAHYKGRVLGFVAIPLVLYFLLELLTNGFARIDFKALFKTPVMIASAIYILMVILSTVFSSFRFSAFHGTVERGEGMWTLFAYFIVFFAAMFYVRKGWHAKIIMLGLAFSSIIMGLIGLSQFLERDFFMTDFGQWFLQLSMSPEQVAGLDEGGVTSPFVQAFGTLYNPNTFGKYTAMAAPILLTLALVFDEKGWKGICGRLAFLLAGGLMLVGVFGSRSLGGFIGIAAAIGVVAIVFICRFFYRLRSGKNADDTGDAEVTAAGNNAGIGAKAPSRRWVTWAVGAVVAGAITASILFVPIINERFSLVVTRFEEALYGERLPMDDIIFDENRLTFFSGGQEQFTLVVLGETSDNEEDDDFWLPAGDILRIYDANSQPVPLAEQIPPPGANQPYVYIFHVPGAGTLRIPRWIDAFNFKDILLTMFEGRLYAVFPNNDLIDMHGERAPAIGFEGREHWGTNRGYIWSRTFPLLPSRIILGSGPDTFIYVFPQHDIIARMALFSNPYIPVDKAHNVYLQTWVTTGGISAFAQIFLFGFYIVLAFMQVVRSNIKEGSFLFGLQVGLLAGISAFCVAAMSTDSTIGSSAVFYVLLGVGYGMVYMIRRVYGGTERA